MLKTGSLLVKFARIKPNPWNPNRMPDEYYEKLKNGIKRTLEEAGKVPPIVVRPNKDRGCYEIVDGEHRWKAFKDLGIEKIPVFSMKVSDQTARILTQTLNYLRGEPEGELLSKNIIELLEQGVALSELEELLPLTSDELSTILDSSRVTIEAYKNLMENSASDSEQAAQDLENAQGDDSRWVDLKYRVSLTQAKIIEAEIARISGTLKGKSARSRALELMAVNSSHTSLAEIS